MINRRHERGVVNIPQLTPLLISSFSLGGLFLMFLSKCIDLTIRSLCLPLLFPLLVVHASTAVVSIIFLQI